MTTTCTKCGGDVTITVHDTAADNVPAEVSYECKVCGAYSYFAYGKWEDGECYVEESV